MMIEDRTTDDSIAIGSSLGLDNLRVVNQLVLLNVGMCEDGEMRWVM